MLKNYYFLATILMQLKLYIMKNIKFLVTLLLLVVFNSCTKDDSNFEKPDTFNATKKYYEVINSSDPRGSFDELTPKQKAKLWGYKYDIFIKESELTTKQIFIINNLKQIAINTTLDINVKSIDIKSIESNLLANFTEDQYFDLLYFLDNPSLKNNSRLNNNGKNCFWCTMYEPIGPCHYDEHGDYIQEAQFYTCRFWHCSDAGTGIVMCDDGLNL